MGMNTISKRPGIPKIALFFSLNFKGHRDCLAGILDYVRLHKPWHLHLMEGRVGGQRLIQIRKWGCTGIIGSPLQPEAARLIQKAQVPSVLLMPPPALRAPSNPLSRYTYLTYDSLRIGQMAADYFLAKNYQHFAYVNEPLGLYWSKERKQGYVERLRQAGFACKVYDTRSPAERQDWAIEQPHLTAWLRELPKPIALFASMDERGRQVIDACMEAGIAVPDQVAVLGVDNDEILCEATFPPLSSIEMDIRQKGYLIAEHLDRLLHGSKPRKRIITVQPLRVILRRSTDTTANINNPVFQAQNFIRETACLSPIHVPEVTRIIGGSRRFAEKRFKAIVGKTILEEIQHIRMEKVCQLLTETRIPLHEVARRCQFKHANYLARRFKRQFGMTLSRYREKMSPT